MLTSAELSCSSPERHNLYHGLFDRSTSASGQPRVVKRENAPRAIPCPTTGRDLRISTLDAGAPAICPKCSAQGFGGFVSFVGDLRMVYACPDCRELVWLAGL